VSLSEFLYTTTLILYKLIPHPSMCTDNNIIVKLHAYPTTETGKLFTSGAIFDITTDFNKLHSILISKTPIVVLTKLLKPYMTISDSIFDIDHGFGEELHAILNDINEHKSKSKVEKISNAIGKINERIKDGNKLHDDFHGNVTQYGKFSRISGGILNQLKSSFYNHRLLNKLSLDEQLEIIHRNPEDDERELPHCYDQFDELLKSTCMLSKTDVIHSGHQLSHCIGSYANNNDVWLFRKGDICASVNPITYRITQCYDYNNKVTDDSKLYRSQLEESLSKLPQQEDTNPPTEINAFENAIDLIVDNRNDFPVEELKQMYIKVANMYVCINGNTQKFLMTYPCAMTKKEYNDSIEADKNSVLDPVEIPPDDMIEYI